MPHTTCRFSGEKQLVFPHDAGHFTLQKRGLQQILPGAFGNELFIVAKALVTAQRLQYPVLLTRRAGAMGKVPWQGDTCGTIPRIESRGMYVYNII